MRHVAVSRYDAVARTLHWATAGLFAWQFLSRLWWEWLPEGSPLKFHLAGLHTLGGLVVMTLAAVRLWWRWRHPPPPDAASRAGTAAHAVHMLLYLLMLTLPVLGFLAVRQPALAAWHGYLAWAALGLVALHVGAALWHRWVLRDSVLQRML